MEYTSCLQKKINQFFLRSIANSHTLARLHCRGTRMDGMLELRCSYGNTILLQKCVWDNSETLTQQAWPCLRCVITLPAGLVTSYFSHVHLHLPLVILHCSNSNKHPRHQPLWDPLLVCRRVVPPCFTQFDNTLIPTLPNKKGWWCIFIMIFKKSLNPLSASMLV